MWCVCVTVCVCLSLHLSPLKFLPCWSWMANWRTIYVQQKQTTQKKKMIRCPRVVLCTKCMNFLNQAIFFFSFFFDAFDQKKKKSRWLGCKVLKTLGCLKGKSKGLFPAFPSQKNSSFTTKTTGNNIFFFALFLVLGFALVCVIKYSIII